MVLQRTIRPGCLMLPLAALRYRARQARLICASSAVGFCLFGVTEGLRFSLKAVTRGGGHFNPFDAVMAVLVSLGLLTMLFLTSAAIAQTVRNDMGDLVVLKALGFSSPRIVFAVFLEAALPGLLGTVLGLCLSQPAAAYLVHLLSSKHPLPSPHIGTEQLGGALGLATLIVLAAVLLPALRIIRLNVATALSCRP
jgi:ABC-type antimicrobial peptide transport system permease subunit